MFLKSNFSLRNWKNVTHFRPTFLYPLKNLWFTVSMEHGQGALTQVTFYTCNPFQANVFISPEKSLVYGIYGAWTGSIDPSYPSYAFMIYDQFMIYVSVETIWWYKTFANWVLEMFLNFYLFREVLCKLGRDQFISRSCKKYNVESI